MVFVPPKIGGGSTKPLQLLPIRDWTGGLNLRDDAFQVKPNELTDAMNVDVQVTGGIARRKTVQRLNPSSAASTSVRTVYPFLGPATPQILVQIGSAGRLGWTTAAGTITELSAAPFNVAVTGLMRFATMARITGAAANVPNAYVQRNWEAAPVRWTGAAATALTYTFNDNLASPAGGNMPVGKFLRAHLDRMWVAGIVETGAVLQPSRVRFSHPGEPEDYRTNDYIDIDPGDGVTVGEGITGLSSIGEQLLVFKRKSVHIINGYDPTTFSVVPLSLEIGAVSQEAIASSETGVAWFDGDRGVFLYDGSKVHYLFDNLVSKIDDGTIQTLYRANTVLSWVGNRLYCSVTYGAGATTNTVVFIYDPRTSAWTVHQFADLYGLGPMCEFKPNNALTLHVACPPTASTWIWLLESGANAADDLDSGTDPSVTSFFATAWFDAGAPGVRKRWRRPTFIADADVTTEYSVSVWKDYHLAASARTFPLTFTPPSLGGSALIWGSGTWGSATWGSLDLGGQALAKGSAFGNAIAVRLKITGPGDTPWNMNAMQFRYVVGRIH